MLIFARLPQIKKTHIKNQVEWKIQQFQLSGLWYSVRQNMLSNNTKFQIKIGVNPVSHKLM